MSIPPFPATIFTGDSAPLLGVYGTNESTTEQTGSGGGATNNDVLSGAEVFGTPTASSDYLWFWSQDLFTGSTGIRGFTDIHLNGSSIFTTRPRWLPNTNEEYSSMGGMFRTQAWASPSPIRVSLRMDTENPGSVNLRNSRLSYVRMGADDEYTESIARQTTTSATAQTMATLSFTPPSSGDYIIIASFNIDLVNASNVRYSVELTDEAGNTTTEVEMRPLDNTSREPMMLILPCTGLSGAKNFKLKIRESGSGSTTIGISEIRMAAIRNSRFASVNSILLTSASQSTSTTFNDALTHTVSPSGDHLLLACWAIGMDSTSIPGGARLLDDADTVNECLREGQTSLVGDGLPGVGHRLKEYAGGSIAQAIQKRSVGAADDVQVQAGCAAIVLFKLEGLT